MTANLATIRRALHHDGIDELPGWTPGVGHLDRCRSAAGPARTCPNCEMHVLTPVLTHLLATLDDIDALVGAPTSLATAVAVAELCRSFDSLATDGHEAVGVHAVREQIGDATGERLQTLRQTVESSLADGGPLADDLERTACLLAVPRLVAEPRLLADAMGRDLPRRVLDELEVLDQLTDARRVASVLIDHADRAARRGLPPLGTQPEWERLPAPPPRSEQAAGATLEALVAESVADEVLERALKIAASLAALPGRRVVRRPSPTVAMSSSTRSLVWRRATINWPLSVADTGLAQCWQPTCSPDRLRLAIPLLAAAGLSTERDGARTTSALHPAQALSV